MDYLELPEHQRYHLGKVQHPRIYKIYETSRSMIWNEGEVSKELTEDIYNKHKLPNDQRITLLKILSFFAKGDGIVNETSSNEITPRITIMEACMVYRLFMAQEDVHNIVYTKLVELYSNDDEELSEAFDALHRMPSVAAKKAWSDKWSKDAPIAQVLLCNIIIEGLFFSSSFCYIFWINTFHDGLLPGLANSNEWISRDEGIHTNFGIMLYLLSNLVDADVAKQMFMEALDAELMYVNEIFDGCTYYGMNTKLMSDYVRFTANGLLTDIRMTPFEYVANPFPDMMKQSAGIRIGDFFTRDISDYALYESTAEDNAMIIDDDF